MLDIFAPGNKITYNPMNIHFLVDSKLESWRELHTWFRSIASPESYAERKTLSQLQNQFNTKKSTSYSDATLTVLSALNNPIVKVQFYNVFPLSLSDIQFDTMSSADTIPTAEASFMYDYYEIVAA